MRVQHLKRDTRTKHPTRQPPKWMREAVARAVLEEVAALSQPLPEMACVEGEEQDELKCS